MRSFFRPVPLAVTALTFLLLYALVGFFFVPYLIKSYAIPLLAETLEHPVLVKEAEFNPFELSIRLTGFEVREKDETSLIGFDEFFVDLRAVSLIRRAYVFDTIRLTLPYVSVQVFKDGRMNLADLVPPDESQLSPPAGKPLAAPSEIPAVQIGRFEIAQGIVEFRDESKSKPVSIDIVPINLVLNNFHTKPGGDNTYAFTAELGKGETLDWKGTISLEPIRSEGTLALSGVKVPTLFQYVQDQFNFVIPAGTIQAKGQYRFDAAASPIDLDVSEASIRLADIRLAEKFDPEPVIALPSIDVDGIHLDLRERTLSIASIALADGSIHTWLNPDGSSNFQSLFAPAQAESTAVPQVKGSASRAGGERPWAIVMKDVHLSNHAIRFEDRSLSLPMRADVTKLSVKTHDITVPIKGPIPLAVDLTLNETGRIAVDGQVVVTPLQLDMTLGLKDVAIQPFQPYFEKFARIAVDGGTVDLDGKLHMAAEHPKAPLLTYRGNLGVKSLAIADRDQGSPVASWKQLQLSQVALAVDPTTVTIDEVGLEQPTVHLVLQPDGQLNLTTLPARPEASTPPAAQKSSSAVVKKGSPPVIAVKTVKLLKGTATFQDESIAPAVHMGLYDLAGTVKGLSSKQLARAAVDLSGTVDKVAPLKITGQINPLSEDAFTDLSVKFDNVDLTAVASYSGKYAGYPVRKGKLFLDLTYKVSQKQLEAENKMAIDQLTFGEKTDSPDATSLPVPLAVALLKDRNGRIDIDLPIRGDLNDPDFKYGRVVLSTLMNLLTKLVASPFTLLGKLIPGGGSAEELQFLEFEPGSAVVGAAEVKKCAALRKGLEERPGLRLEIIGAADPARDRQAIRLQRFRAQLMAKWQQERALPKDADFPVTEEERMIKELFERQHAQPTGAAPVAKPEVLPKPPTIEEMRQQLSASIPVDETSLRSLADQRARQIRDQLAGEGKLVEERVFLTEVDLTASDHERVRSRLNIAADQ